MVEKLHILQRRAGLQRTRERLQAGALTIGFLGGSITDPAALHNWPEPVVAWLVNTYPHACISLENAAIGATGSDLAAFRIQRDIHTHGCDLVFVEYAVNDNPVSERTLHSREGVLRQLLDGEGCDVVLVYTFSQPMYAAMIAGEVPESIAQFERLAEHYRIPSIWMSLHAFRQVQQGYMRWEEWLPDGLHPHERGSLSYAEAVISYLQQELGDQPSQEPMLTGHERPAPLSPLNWEHASILPWDRVTTHGPWTLRRWSRLVAAGQVLITAAPGATLHIPFTGHGILLTNFFGKNAAEFRWRIDEGAWQETQRERPAWAGELDWLRVDVLHEELPEGTHTCDIEVLHGDRADCMGTTAAIVFIGILAS